MTLEITLDTDNAAFCNEDGDTSGYSRDTEVARILSDLARRINKSGMADYVLTDINGNSVGQLRVTE